MGWLENPAALLHISGELRISQERRLVNPSYWRKPVSKPSIRLRQTGFRPRLEYGAGSTLEGRFSERSYMKLAKPLGVSTSMTVMVSDPRADSKAGTSSLTDSTCMPLAPYTSASFAKLGFFKLLAIMRPL